ncbi:WD repeat protein [Aspergillus sclerotialis]|uniref:WD repeat protein n=1 Tax=Aspergillus sclerotialis TaxID=2070753 RepID=A0A3A2ZN36_9EURO|nr:WD repeat protein [Aspergillus sclerotialis]
MTGLLGYGTYPIANASPVVIRLLIQQTALNFGVLDLVQTILNTLKLDQSLALRKLLVTFHESGDFQLRQVSSFHNHTGKNIFCLDMYRASREAIIHTGGADGALKTLRINEHDTANRLTDGTSTLPDSRHSPKPKSRYLFRKYSLVSSDCFLAAGVQGEIQLGRLIFEKEAKSASNFQVITETLCVDEDLRSFSAIASLPNKGLVLLGNAKGLIRLYNHNNRSLSVVTQVDQKILGLYAAGSESHSPLSNSSLLSFVTSYVQDFTASLFIISAESSSSDMHVNSITLHLPVHFEINCVSLICSNQCLVLGSRRGALAIYLVSNSGQPLQPLTVIRRVHGDHIMSGVTQITPFWQFTSDNDTITEYFLTCGRDGQYCVHEMKVSKSLENPMSHKIVHHSNPPLGTIIAGAYFDKVSEDLMLYGFHHKNFVLWNETVHTEVLTIDCGGARGNWSIHPSDGTTGGMLLWSQGPALNAYRLPTDSSRPIRAGVHGREIKSMEVLNTPDKNKTIFATGSEDTTVRIFTPIHSQSESTWGSFKCLRVLKQLASLQQVSFSKNGKFLFISGGLEEFCIWKICLIPVFGLAGCLVASSPKNDSNSDLRVTSFDILDVDEPGSEDSFLICLTLSNSTIKIFHFSSSAKDGFTLLARGTYTSNCLTQARFLRKNSTMSLITTCTDGHFALWSLTPLLKPLYTLTSPTLSTKQQFSPAIIAPENIEYDSRYQIHSNSIKSMEITHLSDTLTLIAAGGDDNAVSLSLVSTDFIASDLNASVMTVSIPDAHAASVTAVKVLSQTVTDNTTTVHIASSGNDHQVKIWSVVVDPQKDGTECMNVKNVANEYSNVADISSLDVIYGDADGASTLLDGNGNSKLLVCGVGMEMLRIKPCRL